MNHKTIEIAIKKRLLESGHKMNELAAAIGLTNTAWCNYYNGRVKKMTPDRVNELAVGGLKKLNEK